MQCSRDSSQRIIKKREFLDQKKRIERDINVRGGIKNICTAPMFFHNTQKTLL